MKKLWATLSVVSSVSLIFAANSAMAAPVKATPVVNNTVRTDLAEGNQLWQKYLTGEELSNDDITKLITFVSDDVFLDNIHSLDRDSMVKWRELMKIARTSKAS